MGTSWAISGSLFQAVGVSHSAYFSMPDTHESEIISELEVGWKWAGSGLEVPWKWTGSELEVGWKWAGGGLEVDWDSPGHS